MVVNAIRITIEGKRYMAIPEVEYRRLARRADDAGKPPQLPPADARGGREALATMAALIAQDVHKARTAAGMTQTQLAEAAGVRPETISRIESARHTPSTRTMRKIDKALGL